VFPRFAKAVLHACPWIIAVVASVAFAASFSELQRMRARFGEVTRHTFHDHAEVRQFMISAALADVDQPIVVLGDSITEMARLPEAIEGHPVINAGIGGATIGDFLTLAPRLLERSKPHIIAAALGTNGSETTRQNYISLLRALKKLAPRLIAVGVPPQARGELINIEIEAAADSEGVPFLSQPLPEGTQMADRIHLNSAGYRVWTPRLIASIIARVSQETSIR
jgi:GDSL-like lipase/acylhydrolase family protein